MFRITTTLFILSLISCSHVLKESTSFKNQDQNARTLASESNAEEISSAFRLDAETTQGIR